MEDDQTGIFLTWCDECKKTILVREEKETDCDCGWQYAVADVE